jgi:hypothetical protein
MLIGEIKIKRKMKILKIINKAMHKNNKNKINNMKITLKITMKTIKIKIKA